MFVDRRMFDEALEHYEIALELDPKNFTTLSAIGFTWHLQGRLDEAIDFYHKALMIAPDDQFTTQAIHRAILSHSSRDLSL